MNKKLCILTVTMYTCKVQRSNQSDEQRYGIGWQFRLQPAQKLVQIKLGDVLDNGRHPRLALDAGNVDAVDDAVCLLEDLTYHRFNFYRGYVLSAPS